MGLAYSRNLPPFRILVTPRGASPTAEAATGGRNRPWREPGRRRRNKARFLVLSGSLHIQVKPRKPPFYLEQK